MPRARTAEEVQEFRDKLCAVATRRFAALGYEGVTIRALAAEAGCSPMTPYNYFKDKEEIFAAVRAAAFERLADACEVAAATAPDDPRRADVLARAYLNFAVSEPDAYKIMFELSQPDEAAYPAVVRQVERCRRFMMQPTEILVREGILEGDPEKLSQMFWAGIHGVIVLHMAGKLVSGSSVEELYAMMVTTLTRGARGPRFHDIERALASGLSTG
ncbi:TetR/AcrR family transcriptional regulator [Emcibacter sp. SYSU 3D8]|uniref:TetR/AcrR family transcriptional regulator n=1 Tax=Emcibacter sp. SYSU 3D8 TaxID=3133969 RepID=UPI0031FEAAAA